MSSYKQGCTSGSYSPCDVSCPQRITKSWSQPCVTSCGDSRAVVYPPPVAIVFPGPILSSCPQESIVGSSEPLTIGSSFGYGGSLEGQSSLGSGAPPGGKYSYSCYSRSYKLYQPLKPCVVTGQTKKEQEQIRKQTF